MTLDEQNTAVHRVRVLLEAVGIPCVGSTTARVLLRGPGASAITAPAVWDAPEVVALDSTGALSATVSLGESGGQYMVKVHGRGGEPDRLVLAPSAALAAAEVPGYRDALARGRR
ncbi:hypothetical protein GT755_23295 [Herbidospora sp. NEAU-GS84]|uniref:Uncharacterized protein n=1 Tax=Herbidospora solisilvae TaxID=2696284 RepID=A0A7C9JH18_9ACTN|nr:hypothetical protein [Herbidospora solisilvae]NAS24603.1 hypothetical protein [Herbidospora solisilvae]